jgi:hypothetical protein
MTINDAVQFCKDAWPGEGVTCRTVKGVCEVVGKTGNVMGRAFSWRPALQQAYKPFLEGKMLAEANRREELAKDRELFVLFLWDELKPKFEEWKANRAKTPSEKEDAVAGSGSGNQGADAGGTPAGEAQLVQVDAEEQRPGPAGPARLVLLGDE